MEVFTLTESGEEYRELEVYREKYQLSKTKISVSYRHHNTNNMSRMHSHDYAEIFFLFEGSRFFIFPDGVFSVEEGDVILVRQGEAHRSFDSGLREYKCISASVPIELLPEGFGGEPARLLRPEGEVRASVRAEAEIVRDELLKNGSGSRTVVIAAVMKLICAVLCGENGLEGARVSSPTIGRIGDILSYIEVHYTEELTLGVLSEKFFISEFYLCRLFKECTGKNFSTYLTEVRMRHAKRLLLKSDMNIKTVGKRCGYGSVSAFGAAFRKTEGLSPREYRAAIRANENYVKERFQKS